MSTSPNSVVIGGASQTAIYPSVLGNPDLTWAQCLNYNIGVDVTLWNGLLGMELDAFYKYEYDKLSSVTVRTLLPWEAIIFQLPTLIKQIIRVLMSPLHIRTESEVSAMELN